MTKSKPFNPAHSIVCVFDRVEDAEAALKDLDEHGFGEDAIYVRDDAARELEHKKNQRLFAHVYRAMQGVMSDELSVIKLYEQKIAEGSSFILVPIANPDDVDKVGTLLKAHNVTLATYLGGTSFRKL